MSEKEKNDLEYYEFLEIVRHVSDNIDTIQANSFNMAITYYDPKMIKDQLNQELTLLKSDLSH